MYMLYFQGAYLLVIIILLEKQVEALTVSFFFFFPFKARMFGCFKNVL